MIKLPDILEIDNLYKQYDDFALRHINFRVPRGAIMGLIGGNGAGKTTTIKLILNQIRRGMGSIKVFGLDNQEYELDIKQQLGVVMDEGFFNMTFTPREIASILRKIYEKWDDALFSDYLSRFELPEKKRIQEFSRGMRMKLAIAAALSHHPRLLILDEPTSGLDPVVRGEILDVFRAFIEDEAHGILISSHITSDLEKLADYITLLHKGRLVFSEGKDALLERCAVARFAQSALEGFREDELLGMRRGEFGCELLVTNRVAFSEAHPEITLDRAELEDIMRFYAGGGAK